MAQSKRTMTYDEAYQAALETYDPEDVTEEIVEGYMSLESPYA